MCVCVSMCVFVFMCHNLNVIVSTNGNPHFRAATRQTHQVKNMCVRWCMYVGMCVYNVCVCVCVGGWVGVLKGPCGVGTCGLIPSHLVFAQIPLSHAVSARLTLWFCPVFAQSPVDSCTRGKTSAATILHKWTHNTSYVTIQSERIKSFLLLYIFWRSLIAHLFKLSALWTLSMWLIPVEKFSFLFIPPEGGQRSATE